jgi:FMN phosphatase YigB (HAD superfamily)
MKRYKTFFFDFDGVIIDSLNVKENGFRSIFPGNDDKINIREGGKSRYEKIPYYYELVYGKKPSEEEVEKLLIKFSESICNKLMECSLIDGIIEFLEIHKKRKCPMYVVSNALPVELYDVMKRRSLINYFEDVFCTIGSKYDKHDFIKLKTKKDLNAVFFGDEISDLEEANTVGIDFIGVDKNKDVFPEDVRTIRNFRELLT